MKRMFLFIIKDYKSSIFIQWFANCQPVYYLQSWNRAESPNNHKVSGRTDFELFSYDYKIGNARNHKTPYFRP